MLESIQIDSLSEEAGIPVFGLYVNDVPLRPCEYPSMLHYGWCPMSNVGLPLDRVSTDSLGQFSRVSDKQSSGKSGNILRQHILETAV